MMSSAAWFLLIGSLLIGMAVISTVLKRLPLTAAILYLATGLVLGRTGLISLDPVKDVSWLRALTEIAVLVSLFTTGLKLRLPLNSPEWRVPFSLATLSMTVTILLVACCGVFFLHLSWGAALLLGAILAPTDPVLASSVQVLSPEDHDRLRFSLTAEAGLNDGTAFPFVLLGLGLLGLRDMGEWGWRWFAFDLLWGIVGGLCIGTFIATAAGKLIQRLQKTSKEIASWNDFLCLGLIAFSFGISELVHAYGFLAVFAAGLALRRRERKESHLRIDTFSSHMAQGVLQFNEHMERIGELVIVTTLGVMASQVTTPSQHLWLIPLLFFVIRPASVWVGMRNPPKRFYRSLIAWFGIRGMGSLYYLAFAIEHGLPEDLAHLFIGLTLSVVIASIFIHGLSAAPLMLRHELRARR